MTNKEKILKLHNFLNDNNRFNKSNYNNLVFKDGEMFTIGYEDTVHQNPYLIPATDEDFDNNLCGKLEEDYIQYSLDIAESNKRKQIIGLFYNN